MKANFYFNSLGFILGLIGLGAHAAGGSFHSVAVANAEWKSIEINDGTLMSGYFTGASSVVTGEGLIRAGMTSTSDCIVSVKKHSEGKDIASDCSVHYKELDSKMFMRFERKAGDGIATSGAKGGGSAIISGGTGKLQGVSGTCSYNIKYLDAVRSVTNMECDYSM
jgi:hypothetical protein